MKFFIDTADVQEIREAKSLGVLDGVTTNPSLIAKTGRPWRDVVNEICKIVDGPISVETTTQSARELILEGEALSKINSNVVVKVALTEEGLKGFKKTFKGVEWAKSKDGKMFCYEADIESWFRAFAENIKKW